jgi:hypothetical protein
VKTELETLRGMTVTVNAAKYAHLLMEVGRLRQKQYDFEHLRREVQVAQTRELDTLAKIGPLYMRIRELKKQGQNAQIEALVKENDNLLLYLQNAHQTIDRLEKKNEDAADVR